MGAHPDVVVQSDLNGSVPIRSKDGGTRSFEPFKHVGRGMPIHIAPARSDHRKYRPDGGDEGRRRRGPAAVMSYLEDLGRRGIERLLGQAFDIAREQDPREP